MNYDTFHRWVMERVEDLVEFGVSRREAMHLMKAVEVGAIADEAANKADRQFLIDFERVGAKGMAERYQKTPAWARKKERTLRETKQTVAT